MRSAGAGLAVLAFAAAGAVDAAETADAVVRDSEFRDGERRATAWRLAGEDWSRYEELMRGRRGVWSPDADPLLA